MTGHQSTVFYVAFGPKGQALSSGDDRTMRLWDLTTGEQISTFTGHRGHVRSVAYSDKAKLAATSCSDKLVRLWNLETGQLVRTLRGHTEQVEFVCFSPDGKQLLSSGYDHTPRLWDVETGKELKRFAVPEGFSGGFSPDGKRLVTGGIRNHPQMRVWDIESGKELRSYQGRESVTSVAFFPDGKRIASVGDEDDTIRIWRAPR